MCVLSKQRSCDACSSRFVRVKLIVAGGASPSPTEIELNTPCCRIVRMPTFLKHSTPTPKKDVGGCAFAILST